MPVYLIHLDEKMAHSQHYCGYADDIDTRIEKHRKGNGSAFMTAVKKAGITWLVARVWPLATRHYERTLKNTHNLSLYCPICRAMKKEERR